MLFIYMYNIIYTKLPLYRGGALEITCTHRFDLIHVFSKDVAYIYLPYLTTTFLPQLQLSLETAQLGLMIKHVCACMYHTPHPVRYMYIYLLTVCLAKVR